MGVIWLGGAAIRARYVSRVQTKVLMPSKLRAQTMLLREVLTDQSDRAHHAGVSGW